MCPRATKVSFGSHSVLNVSLSFAFSERDIDGGTRVQATQNEEELVMPYVRSSFLLLVSLCWRCIAYDRGMILLGAWYLPRYDADITYQEYGTYARPRF